MSQQNKPIRQLEEFHASAPKSNRSATTSFGTPIVEKNACLTVGSTGPMLLEDTAFIDELAHFTRERIPERVVHAKGGGAFGFFEVTHDITKYTAAKVFEKVGKQTKVAVRFSTVGGESGSADTVRDPRGFAVKFYTDDGIWDLVGNNTPVFFIRDPILFPSLIHTQKRNPVTHLKDPDMFWDFISLRPETTHQIMILFGDRGIPDGYRFMNGYGSHTFKLVNEAGIAVYCKFHLKSNQGIKNLDPADAQKLAGTSPDYAIEDLYNAIARQDFPSWNFYIQVMTLEQAEKSSFNPFDLTKVWSHKYYPLIPVGKLVLEQNPTNYFADVEQLAFSPAHMIPGIEPSPDRMLIGRMFAYGDTHRHRLGANYLQLPVNCPYRVRNFQRDGPQAFNNQGGAPNYFPNSFGGPDSCPKAKKLTPAVLIIGEANRYDIGKEDNYYQARQLYLNVFTDDERQRFVNNVVESLRHASQFIQFRAIDNFDKVDNSLAKTIADRLSVYLGETSTS